MARRGLFSVRQRKSTGYSVHPRAGRGEYPVEVEIEIGRKTYLVEGAIMEFEVPRRMAPGEVLSSPEDLHERRFEAVAQAVFEFVPQQRPKPWRVVGLREFMRRHGTLMKAKLMAKAEAEAERAYEARAERW